MNNPTVLILANTLDFSSDYIVARLRRKKVKYLRLNSDDLANYRITFDPINKRVEGVCGEHLFTISNNNLKAIYFRAPAFLRDHSPKLLTVKNIIKRTQWAAFYRSLMVFRAAKWINHPQATYLAEVKPLQLVAAREAGFEVPKTIVANHFNDNMSLCLNADEDVAVKGLDTVLFSRGNKEGFLYTKIVKRRSLSKCELGDAPLIFQEALKNKRDIRVTVIGDKTMAVEIIPIDGGPIEGDWRLMKKNLSYRPLELPKTVRENSLELVKKLGLAFGAIDLVRIGDRYVFLEINPTGEWAWLNETGPSRIDDAIVNAMLN